MRKTNKKGFTLIELLAVIVILAIIIVMAVASVGAVLNRMKKNAYVVEANTIVKALKNKAVLDTSVLPTEDEAIISISDIELQNGTKSPYGSPYKKEESYVKIKKLSGVGVYSYSICIVDEKGNGIEETNIDEVTRNSITTDVDCSTEPEPVVILSKAVDSVNLYTDITGGWFNKRGTSTTIAITQYSYNGYKYPLFWASLANGTSKAYPNNKIDVTNYKTITASGEVWTDDLFDSTIILGLKNSSPTFSNTDFDYQITTQTGTLGATKIPFNLTLNITAVSGEYYIILAATHGSSPDSNSVNLVIDNITLS